MSKNAQHQWEPVIGSDNLVKCKKCKIEVKASRARRGAGPCIWGEPDKMPPVPNEDRDTGLEATTKAEINETVRSLVAQHPGPRLTDPPEYCNGCGKQLAILPLNSRLDMVACNNRGCALHRERIRMVTKPTERGKRKRAKGKS